MASASKEPWCEGEVDDAVNDAVDDNADLDVNVGRDKIHVKPLAGVLSRPARCSFQTPK